MANVETVKRDIETLSPGEVSEVQAWLSQQTGDQPIDLRIKADLEAGKLNNLVANAIAEDEAGLTTPL